MLRQIAASNGRPLPPDFRLTPPDHGDNDAGRGMLGIVDLFKTPNLRKKTLIIYYMWFATSLVYYGLTLNSNKGEAGLFTYFCIGKGRSETAKTYLLIVDITLFSLL